MAYPKILNREIPSEPKANPIIKGKFASRQVLYKKPAIFRVNIALGFCLLIVLIFSMLTYFGVVAKESKVKELHSATNEINYENIELQNKVDSLKSYYTLDNKVQKMDFLKKPDQILEVKTTTKTPLQIEKKEKFDVAPVAGF